LHESVVVETLARRSGSGSASSHGRLVTSTKDSGLRLCGGFGWVVYCSLDRFCSEKPWVGLKRSVFGYQEVFEAAEASVSVAVYQGW